MTDFLCNLTRGGTLNAAKLLRAIDRQIPVRHIINEDELARGPFGTSYETVHTITVNLNPDDVCIITADILYKSDNNGATGQFKFVVDRVDYSTDPEVGIGDSNASDVLPLHLTAVIENKIGNVPVQVMAKKTTGDELNVVRSKVEALIFKKRSLPIVYPEVSSSSFYNNLELWLDAEQLFTADANFLCSALTDQSTNVLTIEQATAGDRPTISRKDHKENLLLYSEDFTNAAWSKNNCSVVAGSTVNPLTLTSTATKLIEGAVTNDHYVRQVSVPLILGVRYRFSIYARFGSRTQLRMVAAGTAFPGGASAYFDIDNAQVLSVTGSGVTATISEYDSLYDRWVRCEISFTTTAAGTCNADVHLASGGTSFYAGDGTSYLYIYGADLCRAIAGPDYVSTLSLPTYRGIGGHRSLVSFSNDKLSATGNPAALKIPGNFLIFAVVELWTPSSSGSTEFIINAATSNTSGFLLWIKPASGTVGYESHQAGTHQTITSSNGAISQGTPALITVRHIGTTIEISVNGKLVASGTVTAPVDQTFYQIGLGTDALSVAFLAVFSDSGTSSMAQAEFEQWLMRRFIRGGQLIDETDGTLKTEVLENRLAEMACRFKRETWSGSSTLSGSNNTIDSITFQLEEDEGALILADLDYRSSGAGDGQADIYLNINGALYNEKYGIDYTGTTLEVAYYHGNLMAMKNDGNGSLVTVDLKHDAVSGTNITVTESQLLVFILKKRP